MKILYVTNALVSSGAEDHLEDIAAWMKTHGHDPAFLVSAKSALSRQMSNIGVPFHEVFDRKRRLSLPYRIGKAVLSEQPDIISINREHNIIPTLWATRFVSPWLKKKPKMVAVFHTPTGRYYPGLKNFDGVIATSEYTGASFVRKNPEIERMTEIIHYGVRLPAVDETAKKNRNRTRRYFRDRGFPIIAMVGELWKNQEELVDAAPAMLEAFPDMTLALVGGYNEPAALKERIARLGLQKHFVLTGRLPRNLIPDVFHDLDLSVSTHRNEGFGIVHIESIASLTPVVAYNSGGLVEIIRKGGGVLVNGGVREFAQAVVDLLSDDEKRFHLGIEGRKVAEEYFSIDAMGKNHLRFYEKILAGKP
ncbi:MAG: glycosyltransferase family 4 protein [Syntrophorhabdaceae bacterium]|nr:glycosyltransferase family 4 protein [Syntrophorhabdaceae bacterium]